MRRRRAARTARAEAPASLSSDRQGPRGPPEVARTPARSDKFPRSRSREHLRHGSAVLEQLIEKDGLWVVGAQYSLETGVVNFFDGVPAAD
jgi:hypothetical protein